MVHDEITEKICRALRMWSPPTWWMRWLKARLLKALDCD